MQTFSTAAGPMVGGLISSVIGLRNTFYVTSVIYVVSLIYVHFGYSEVHGDGDDARPKEDAARVLDILRLPWLLPVFIVVFLIQYIDRSFGPVIPFYVAQLHGFGKSAAVISGAILTSGSLAVAIASIWWGRRTKKARALSMLVTTTVAGTVVSLAMTLSGSIASLAVPRVIQGLTAGGTMTLAYSWGGAIIPERIRTSSFTLLTSASLYVIAVSPLLSGLLMTLGIKLVFLLNGALYASVLFFLLALRKAGRVAA